MKSSQCVGLVLAAILSCSIAFAQESAPEKKPDAAPEKAQDTAPPKKPELRPDQPGFPLKPIQPKPNAVQKPGHGREAMIDRRLAAFVRLRELMFETVKLDTDRRKKIDAMFDDYMAGLLNPKQMPHVQPRPEDAATPQELPELRKQLDAAEKADDQEKVASLKAKIYCATIALEPSVIDEPVFFFDYVIKELNEEQRKEFGPILNRWQLLRLAEVASENDFRQLRRTVRDPLLVESKELRIQIETIVIEAIRTVPPGPKRLDKVTMAELAASTKPKVLEKLDPKQREHFEKTLDMLKRWDKEDPEIAKKTRERLKDHQPSQGREKTSIAPAQGSATQP